MIQKAIFEYSPRGKVFNRGLDKNDKKEGPLKRLKNNEGKNEQQLDAIKDQKEKQLDAIKNYDAKKNHLKNYNFLMKNSKKEKNCLLFLEK